MDVKPFFKAVQSFYLATLEKMFTKFPFEDTIMKDLGIAQPHKTKTYTVSTIQRLAKRFPQIELDSSSSLALLAEEFTDFVLSPDEELPTPQLYKDCDQIEKPLPGPYWWEVGRMKTVSGEQRFPN